MRTGAEHYSSLTRTSGPLQSRSAPSAVRGAPSPRRQAEGSATDSALEQIARSANVTAQWRLLPGTVLGTGCCRQTPGRHDKAAHRVRETAERAGRAEVESRQVERLVQVATERLSTRWHFRKGLKVLKGEPRGRPRAGVPGGGTARRRPERPRGYGTRGPDGPFSHCRRLGTGLSSPAKETRTSPPHRTPRPGRWGSAGRVRAAHRPRSSGSASLPECGTDIGPTGPITSARRDTRWGERT